MNRLLVLCLAGALALCMATSGLAAVDQDNGAWKVDYAEAENLLLGARFDAALDKTDAAIAKLKAGGPGPDLAQVYYLKSLLLIYSGHDRILLEKTLGEAIKAAPAMPIPDKEYFADPRLDEWRTKVFKEMSEEAERVVGRGEQLFGSGEYCGCVEVLGDVSWYTKVSVNAKSLIAIAEKKCAPPEPVAAPAAPAAPAVAVAPAAQTPAVPKQDLTQSRKIGVLPICFEGGLQNVYGATESREWRDAMQKHFANYEIELVNNVDYKLMKERFGVEDCQDLLEGKVWVIDQEVVDSIKGVERDIPGGRKYIMEQGGYKYLVVSSMIPKGQVSTLSASAVIFKAQLFSSVKASSPLEDDSRHVPENQLKFFSWYFEKLAGDIDPE
ncbi:hypothetical protein [Pseudodesulfovibrio indicus]|uniref:Uncharacterized protein n=1 Tax=Pseudodesulfovibrio indicus TaxID=1716143 RepID=A0AA94PR62_9BACT|nr:hypothetical protein [Pseudodesulfovibrio indicus]TDT91910.1 hypothetical protein EDC59_101313 [Pseudodesulfovibrio indicus]